MNPIDSNLFELLLEHMDALLLGVQNARNGIGGSISSYRCGNWNGWNSWNLRIEGSWSAIATSAVIRRRSVRWWYRAGSHVRLFGHIIHKMARQFGLHRPSAVFSLPISLSLSIQIDEIDIFSHAK